METLTQEKNTVIEKTEELCKAIVDQPGFEKMKADLAAFEADTAAQKEYNDLLSLQEELQGKQQGGEALGKQDISDFEAKRDALLSNDVARGFLDAQNQMQSAQQTVVKYLQKTFELGRVPEESDLSSGGCCGGGCGGGGGGGGGGCGTC